MVTQPTLYFHPDPKYFYQKKYMIFRKFCLLPESIPTSETIKMTISAIGGSAKMANVLSLTLCPPERVDTYYCTIPKFYGIFR